MACWKSHPWDIMGQIFFGWVKCCFHMFPCRTRIFSDDVKLVWSLVVSVSYRTWAPGAEIFRTFCDLEVSLDGKWLCHYVVEVYGRPGFSICLHHFLVEVINLCESSTLSFQNYMTTQQFSALRNVLLTQKGVAPEQNVFKLCDFGNGFFDWSILMDFVPHRRLCLNIFEPYRYYR